ncbi:DnaD domain protein [Pseudobacteroides cellulosolvens]|uniref:Primosome, DnaD subunit n=1 Tax=Pseudobacteroides cellulosolvens ATCC 35603 = DSM 2933 TaxID=398512 RepID=A0A0L6JVE8_9FIRM|nr:DnaD domain protein [Pseudobacteroides cellulosolvens]KNY29831.1 primosome, DnaD subunit [Pseudobacteroides cellulosolvens ATCC 35603 = DSM 2933]
MFFESYKSILYSDTLVPDIFINEYMPSMDGDCVKIFVHCLFLSKYNKYASAKDLSRKLGIDLNKVKDSLIYLESIGVITRKENSSSITISDLKEKEIKKIYRLKQTSTPEEAILSTERNKSRNAIIKSINNKFFQGVMPPSWYTDIDAWFDKYNFEDDVMFALFQYCYEHNGLSKNYIIKVADSWKSKNVRNSIDLDNYSLQYERFKSIRGKIVKKLGLGRNLTEYESEYVEKWIEKYKYDFEIIELALKKTPKKANPSFEYLNSIITDWYNNNLKTKDEILAYDNARKQSMKQQYKVSEIQQHSNYDQRKYDKDFFENLYEEI